MPLQFIVPSSYTTLNEMKKNLFENVHPCLRLVWTCQENINIIEIGWNMSKIV